MSSVVSVTIGGIDYFNYTDVKSVTMIDGAEATGDTLSFKIVLNSSQLNANPGSPKAGEIVAVTIDGVKHFEGVIETVDQLIYSNANTYAFSCRAGDYTFLLNKHLVTEKISAQTAGGAVRYLVQKYAPGFGIRYVRDGFSVPEQEFDHEALTSVLNQYAQAVAFFWYVDFDREVHFSEGEAQVPPIAIINLNTETRLGGVTLTEDVAQLKNRVYVKDATTKSVNKRLDQFVADGSQSFFSLFSPPFDLDDMEVFRNDNPVTVYEDPLTTQAGETQGAEGTCFVCIINQGLRFPLNDLPLEGDLIRAEYFPEEGGGDSGIVIVVEDPDSIRMMRQRESSTGYISNGVHETVISAPELRTATLDPLSFLGGVVLDRAAWPEISGNFTANDPAIRGWKAGQSFRLTSTNWNLFSTRDFWRTGIKTSILLHVQQVKKTFTPYRVSASNIEFLYGEEVLFSSVPARASL